MKVRFGIIGNNWGDRIYKILKSTNNDVIKLSIKNPNKYINYKSYIASLSAMLKTSKNKCNVIWLAITPNKKIQFDIVKECIENNFNLVIEKPWLVDREKTAYLNDKLKNIHFNELGSHLLAIKKYYFENNKNLKISTGYQKNLRSITFNKNKYNEKIFDFTNNKEPLIQRFIKDYLKHLNNKEKYSLDFTLALMK